MSDIEKVKNIKFDYGGLSKSVLVTKTNEFTYDLLVDELVQDKHTNLTLQRKKEVYITA